MKKPAIIAATAVSVLGLGLGVSQLAMADPTTSPSSPSSSSSSTPAPSGTASTPADGQPMDGQHGGVIEQKIADQLATKLGMDATTVQQALHATRQEISQKRADTTDWKALRDEFVNTLAGKLGVSTDKLQQALDAVRQENQQQRMTNFNNRIDKAVANGTLTQAEGDAVKSAAAKGVIGPTAHR